MRQCDNGLRLERRSVFRVLCAAVNECTYKLQFTVVYTVVHTTDTVQMTDLFRSVSIRPSEYNCTEAGGPTRYSIAFYST